MASQPFLLTSSELFTCDLYPLQAGVGPGQLQSDPGLNRAGVQTLHLPVSPARPRTGKGKERQSDRRNVSIRLLQLKSHLNPRFSAPFPLASLPKEASLLRVCAKSLLPAQRVHLCVSEILRRPAPQVHSHKKLKPFIYLPTLMIINQSVFVQFGNHFGQHLLLCGSKKGEGNVVPSSAHLESKAHICCCGHVTSRRVCFGRQPYSYLLPAGSTCQLNSIKSHFSASMPAIAVFALREFV